MKNELSLIRFVFGYYTISSNRWMFKKFQTTFLLCDNSKKAETNTMQAVCHLRLSGSMKLCHNLVVLGPMGGSESLTSFIRDQLMKSQFWGSGQANKQIFVRNSKQISKAVNYVFGASLNPNWEADGKHHLSFMISLIMNLSFLPIFLSSFFSSNSTRLCTRCCISINTWIHLAVNCS